MEAVVDSLEWIKLCQSSRNISELTFKTGVLSATSALPALNLLKEIQYLYPTDHPRWLLTGRIKKVRLYLMLFLKMLNRFGDPPKHFEPQFFQDKRTRELLGMRKTTNTNNISNSLENCHKLIWEDDTFQYCL